MYPDPYMYYAMCNNQLIAAYRKDLNRFVEDLNALYKEQIDNYGVTILDGSGNRIKILGKPYYENRFFVSDILNLIEHTVFSGNTLEYISQSYSELIFFDHPENAIFSINTSTNLHIHTNGKAYLKIGNFTPPLPTITNWQNVFWRNYFNTFDEHFDTLIFKMKTDKTILLPKRPVKYNLLEDKYRGTQSFSNFYDLTDSTVFLKVGDLKKLDINFSELQEDTNWWFSDFQLIHSTNSYAIAENITLNISFSDNMIVTFNGVAYELSWIVFGWKVFQVTITTDGNVTSTTTIQGVEVIQYTLPIITGTTVIDVTWLQQ